MPSNAASSISGPIKRAGLARVADLRRWRTAASSRATSASAMLSWTISRRSVVQRWPAVPAAENRIARAASSRSADWADDHRIVAAELEQHAAEALGDARADGAAHRGRSGRRHQSDARIVDQRLADVALALHELDQARPAHRRSRASARRTSAITASAHSGVFSLGFQITGSPHTSASAAFHAHTATGKLNALITSTGPSGCHCSIIRWFGPLAGDGQAVELARETDREVADVDHLLHFAEAFLDDLAGFERDQLARAAASPRAVPRRAAGPARRAAAPGPSAIRGTPRRPSRAARIGIADRHPPDLAAVDRRAG